MSRTVRHGSDQFDESVQSLQTVARYIFASASASLAHYFLCLHSAHVNVSIALSKLEYYQDRVWNLNAHRRLASQVSLSYVVRIAQTVTSGFAAMDCEPFRLRLNNTGHGCGRLVVAVCRRQFGLQIGLAVRILRRCLFQPSPTNS